MAHAIDVAETEPGRFEVTVRDGGSSTSHAVTVDPSYAERIAGADVAAADLVRESFVFLLERESKESILGRFELPVIGRYFPEYEREIAKRVRT